MQQLTLKVYPVGRGREVYRIISISGQDTLDQLCSTILTAFDFSHDHLYEFCMDNRPYSEHSYQCEEDGSGKPLTTTKLARLNLAKGQKFSLHYDFGDDWMFTISVHNIESVDHRAQPQCLKSKGTIEQYPDPEGEVGIIPGSQGTSSYIVEGLGNPLSFMSCSHGAGRIMSRTEAVKTLNLAEEI